MTSVKHDQAAQSTAPAATTPSFAEIQAEYNRLGAIADEKFAISEAAQAEKWAKEAVHAKAVHERDFADFVFCGIRVFKYKVEQLENAHTPIDRDGHSRAWNDINHAVATNDQALLDDASRRKLAAQLGMKPLVEAAKAEQEAVLKILASAGITHEFKGDFDTSGAFWTTVGRRRAAANSAAHEAKIASEAATANANAAYDAWMAALHAQSVYRTETLMPACDRHAEQLEQQAAK
jgi:hypothetical protein